MFNMSFETGKVSNFFNMRSLIPEARKSKKVAFPTIIASISTSIHGTESTYCLLNENILHAFTLQVGESLHNTLSIKLDFYYSPVI